MRPPVISIVKVKQLMAEAVQLQRQGLTDAATEAYRKVLKIDSSIAPAHYNLALLLKDKGKTSAADKAFKAAIKCDPDYGMAYSAYARFLGARGRGREAVQLLLKAAQQQGYPAAVVQEIADQVERAGSHDLGAAGDKALLLCLSRGDVSSDGMIPYVLTRLRRNPVFKSVLSRDISIKNIDIFLNKNNNMKYISKAFSEPVIATILARLILPDPDIEQLITVCCGSTTVLESLDEDGLAVLALQRDLSEYIQDISLPDVTQTDLRGRLLPALKAPLQVEDAVDLLETYKTELKNFPWASLLLNKQGPEKRRKLALAEKFTQDSDVKNKTSKAVQDQYEESPYPRWRGLRHGGSITLPELVRTLFPGVVQKEVAAAPKVLIAGCGTGRHALRTAIRLDNAQVTALDLSSASLAYGAWQAAELEIANVEFLQADILSLPSTLGSFDLIECCGVLHHMSDPIAAWSGLLPHLGPNGLMKIALYSEQARQDVVAVHKMADNRKNLSLSDIRHMRQTLLDLDPDHPAASVTRELDFYSLSGCRDFLFHQQEQRFDLPGISKALADLDLEFMGFEFVQQQPLLAYKQAYPDDPTARNLENWRQVENEHPALFRGMYQFWCRMKQGS
jgi:SAM-dependent methyltransferase